MNTNCYSFISIEKSIMCYMSKVSVVVPVFNTENYLSRCIDSIISQTYQNWELILVDDGSNDNSGFLCDQYAAQDSRIRVFHKINGGVSSARNMGIEQSKGDYVMFIDADDWVDIHCLESCFKKCDDVDLYRFGMKSFYKENDGSQNERRIDETLSIEEYLRLIISRKTILGVCGGIYKLSIIKKASIRFCVQYALGEDWFFNFQYLKHCSSLCIIDEPFYSYNRYNSNGCTNNYSLLKGTQMLEIAKLIIQDDTLASRAYYRPKADCKVNVYYQALTNALLLCKDFKQLISYTKRINEFEIKPTVFDIIYAKTSLKGKVYVFISRFSICWYLLYLIKHYK